MGPSLRPVRLPVPLLLAGLLLATGLPRAHASSPIEVGLDLTTLTDMEQRAAAAQPRERCYLYSELLHGWTELAGRSMSEGNDPVAAQAIAHAEADAEQLKSTLAQDSKRLKNAELLLEHTARRLSDMVRVATMDQRDMMQGALKHLNTVHDALLAQIFAR